MATSIFPAPTAIDSPLAQLPATPSWLLDIHEIYMEPAVVDYRETAPGVATNGAPAMVIAIARSVARHMLAS